MSNVKDTSIKALRDENTLSFHRIARSRAVGWVRAKLCNPNEEIRAEFIPSALFI